VAKGKDKHNAYQNALQLLGKDLARRAKSKCELSGTPGTLRIFDLEGFGTEPSLDHTLMVCPEVAAHLEHKGLKGAALHYLETAVWSELPVIRRAAVRILEAVDEPWAREAIDNAKMMDANTAEDDEVY
tara:strand:+ start:5438 stop:5824 length:387 start_codon:yes stop_codon:yes gene_type:complete